LPEQCSANSSDARIVRSSWLCQRRADAIFVEKGLRAGPMTLIRAADPLDLDHPACSF
jgi:hypothetical protein